MLSMTVSTRVLLVSSPPLWVTIMLGVMAVVGTIAGGWGGQVIAARRDDKRWEREAAREELRWERERTRLADERTHLEQLHWRDERLRLYAKFVSDLSEWYFSLDNAAATTAAQEFVSGPQKARARAAKKVAVESYGAARLLASSLVGISFGAAMVHMHKLHTSAVDEETGGNLRAAGAALDELKSNVRKEIGLDGGVARRPSFSQAPPSDPAS
jgi:hypothetical protein